MVRVYDDSFSFYNNSLDFLFASIQSEYEVKNGVRIVVSKAKFCAFVFR